MTTRCTSESRSGLGWMILGVISTCSIIPVGSNWRHSLTCLTRRMALASTISAFKYSVHVSGRPSLSQLPSWGAQEAARAVSQACRHLLSPPFQRRPVMVLRPVTGHTSENQSKWPVALSAALCASERSPSATKGDRELWQRPPSCRGRPHGETRHSSCTADVNSPATKISGHGRQGVSR